MEEDDEEMEAAGGQVEVKDMADVVFTKHTGSITLFTRIVDSKA